MKIIAQGQVAASAPDAHCPSYCSPGLCVLPGGRWLTSWRAAPTKNGTRGQHVLLSHSDDQGRSWSDPRAPFEPPTVAGKAGLFRSAYLTSLSGAPGAGREEVLAALFWVDHSDPDAAFSMRPRRDCWARGFFWRVRAMAAKAGASRNGWTPRLLMSRRR